MSSFSAATIFYHGKEYHDSTVVFENKLLKAIVPTKQAPANTLALENVILTPGFIDCQVYGAEGFLLSEFPTEETLQTMANSFAKNGTVLCLPTVATNSRAVTEACILAVKNYIESGGKGIAGIHLEGPWINPEKRGAHVQAYIEPITPELVQHWLALANGTWKMVTLAPELCSPEILQIFKENNIVVSAGHSAATYTQACEGFKNGVQAVTHLYNAMSGNHHRNPGLVEAALLNNDVFASIIPDGVHVSFEHVKLAALCKPDSLFAITDAVTHTTSGPYKHIFAETHYEANKTLSGSSLTMLQALYNLVNHAKIPVLQAVNMCTYIPSKLLAMPYETNIENWIAINKELTTADYLAL